MIILIFTFCCHNLSYIPYNHNLNNKKYKRILKQKKFKPDSPLGISGVIAINFRNDF